jgi:hypothetical protein
VRLAQLLTALVAAPPFDFHWEIPT